MSLSKTYLAIVFDILDQALPTGTVLFSNGVPYTYQNGMAIFQSPDGGVNYQLPQAQVSPQVYIQPQEQSPTEYEVIIIFIIIYYIYILLHANR